jgi:uncharacterized membrane protein
MSFISVVERIGFAVDLAGVAVMVVGSALALGTYALRSLRGTDHLASYKVVRRDLGRAILLGLELLVAGDIIRTVATTPTFQNVGVLAAIVAIRTFLSIGLIVETEERFPWQPSESQEDSEADE